jgi:hypothetical protein
MKLFEIKSILTEGGMAIKGVSKISQEEVRKTVPDLIKRIAAVLKLNQNQVKLIGSAGKKPNDDDLSGDLDIAVECDINLLDERSVDLCDGQEFRMMKGINVFSFATPVDSKIVQVDLMPVKNIKFAEWSYQANEKDILQGLKGAQRNELFFAIAKFMPQEVLSKDDAGEPTEIKRYFYDLGKGLMTGVRSRIGKNGKNSKNFTTMDKKLIASDPSKIVSLMFGKDATVKSTSTFEGTLKEMKSSNFLFKDKLDEILELAKVGIEKKNLKVPNSIKQ